MNTQKASYYPSVVPTYTYQYRRSEGGNTTQLINGIPVTVSGSMDRGRMRGKLNGGGELLEISTGDGNIHVGKL